MEPTGAILERIGVYAIYPPRPHGDAEQFLGKFPDFHPAFARAQKEATAANDMARRKLESIEFRRFRIDRVTLWLTDGTELRLKIEDPGNDMMSDFEEDPIVGNPLQFVTAHVPDRVLTSPHRERESVVDSVAQIASGERDFVYRGPDGKVEKFHKSVITHLAGYHASCKTMAAAGFDRSSLQRASEALLRTDFGVKNRSVGLAAPNE